MALIPAELLRAVADFLYADPHTPLLPAVCRAWRNALNHHHRCYVIEYGRPMMMSRLIRDLLDQVPSTRHLTLLLDFNDAESQIRSLAVLTALAWTVRWPSGDADGVQSLCLCIRNGQCLLPPMTVHIVLRAVLEAIVTTVTELFVQSEIPLPVPDWSAVSHSHQRMPILKRFEACWQPREA